MPNDAHQTTPPSKGWLLRMLEKTAAEVATWSAWKQEAMRRATDV